MTFGNKLGRGIGYTAAATFHGAAVAVQATGRFGADVVTGTTEGYSEHAERLAAIRAGMKPKMLAIKAPSIKKPVSGPRVRTVA